jgi:hypothetical protein
LQGAAVDGDDAAISQLFAESGYLCAAAIGERMFPAAVGEDSEDIGFALSVAGEIDSQGHCGVFS